MVVDYHRNILEYTRELEILINSKHYSISKVVGDNVNFGFKGVYIISTPKDESIVYAGETGKTIQKRMKDHLSGASDSDLKSMLIYYQKYPLNPKNYLVRCIKKESTRDRIYFENFLKSILKPPFNKK